MNIETVYNSVIHFHLNYHACIDALAKRAKYPIGKHIELATTYTLIHIHSFIQNKTHETFIAFDVKRDSIARINILHGQMAACIEKHHEQRGTDAKMWNTHAHRKRARISARPCKKEHTYRHISHQFSSVCVALCISMLERTNEVNAK